MDFLYLFIFYNLLISKNYRHFMEFIDLFKFDRTWIALSIVNIFICFALISQELYFTAFVFFVFSALSALKYLMDYYPEKIQQYLGNHS
jgi:hypothetical protein